MWRLWLACRPEPVEGAPEPPPVVSHPDPVDLAIEVGGIWDALSPRGPSTVLVKGSLISEIRDGFVGDGLADSVISAHTGVMMPGLVDPHAHVLLPGVPGVIGDPLPDNLRAYLRFGVTTVLDAGGPLATLALRDRIEAGEILGPSMLALGPFLTPALGHPCEVIDDPHSCDYASSPAEAAAVAERRSAQGADGLKIVIADASFTPWPTPVFDLPAVQAAVAASSGLSVAHVDEEEDALVALSAGVSVLAHPPFGAVLSSEGLARISAEASAVHSTVGAFSGLGDLLSGAMTLPEDAPLLAETREAWARIQEEPWSVDPAWVSENARWAEAARENLSLLRAAGAVIVPASDGGYWYVPPGYGLHREWAELARLGWSNEELLAASTLGAARSIGLSDRGLVAEGMRADLLVLDADPRADLASASEPSWVVAAGRPLDREAIVSADVWRSGGGAMEGETCFDGRDCSGDLLCDALLRRCAASCGGLPPYAFEDPCGPTAFCGPSDGRAGSETLCRPVDDPCDPLDPSGTCSPAEYAEVCVPTDLDTSGCAPSGPRAAGESCFPSDPWYGCGQGLYCSPEQGGVCRELCGAGAPCAPGEQCEPVMAAGQAWFGLCRLCFREEAP